MTSPCRNLHSFFLKSHEVLPQVKKDTNLRSRDSAILQILTMKTQARIYFRYWRKKSRVMSAATKLQNRAHLESQVPRESESQVRLESRRLRFLKSRRRMHLWMNLERKREAVQHLRVRSIPSLESGVLHQ